MSYEVKVSDNLSRDKILVNNHEKNQDIISIGKSIDLRNNSISIDLHNGYEEIIPIDESKIFKAKKEIKTVIDEEQEG